jgi:hypothetical protein
VFISHAGEEKRGFVAFLREEFKRRYPALEVFVDEYSLKMGGSAMPAIEAALGDAFVGAPPLLPVLRHVAISELMAVHRINEIFAIACGCMCSANAPIRCTWAATWGSPATHSATALSGVRHSCQVLVYC